jgi:hypothetical protein
MRPTSAVPAIGGAVDRKIALSVSNGQATFPVMSAPARKSRLGLDPLVEACLKTVQTLGPSIETEFMDRRTPGDADGELQVVARPRSGRARFLVRTSRTHLSYALASGFIEQVRRHKGRWILFAPYVPSKIGQHLAEHSLSYADTVGNCHIELDGQGLLGHIEGKKPARDVATRSAGRVPSHQLVFAVLAQPELLNEPIRQIAVAAGVGKTAAADQLLRLEQQGLIHRGRGVIVDRRALLDRWLSAYAEVVRPAWLVGRFRPQARDPEAVERMIEAAWRKRSWAYGGTAAAWRMARFYRGEETVLHVNAAPTEEALRQLRVVPDRSAGPLTILWTPGTIAYAGTAPHLAHPLLVYTEMMASADPRAREAAAELRERVLEP